MSLNIKNPRVHELAREAARVTGKTQTSVIEEALERYLAELTRHSGRLTKEARVDEILTDMRRILGQDGTDLRVAIHDLYDHETGLPR